MLTTAGALAAPTLLDPAALDSHLADRGLAASTRAAYAKDINLFLRWRAGLDISRSLEHDMLGWLNAMRADKASSASIKRRMASCKTWLRFLGETTELLDAYHAPPLPGPRPHPLPGGMDDLRRMLAASTGKARHAIALGGLAGLRVSESCSVSRSDIDHGRMELSVRGKGDRVRHIPIGPTLAGILDEMPVEGLLVPLNPTVARRYVTRVAVEAGIGCAVSSHDLRATFASECYARTRDVVLVSRLLGHASVQTTQAYLSWDMGEMRAAVDF